MDRLEGKTAVVTGAGSGMGRAFAERFARAGMRVVLADVEVPNLDAAVASVESLGAEALAVPTDVSDPTAVEKLRDEALARFGAVHVVCNNAGVGGFRDTLETWQWVINVNLWGVVHGMRTFLPLLREQDEGHIVNTASMAGIMPGFSAYSASKWAVVGMSEGLFGQLRASGSSVGVSCLCPGFVRTAILDSERNIPEWAAPNALAEDEDERAADPARAMMAQFMRDSIEAGRPPEEVADLVHDAIVSGTFWIFTDQSMVDAQRPRLEALLAGTNPEPWSLMPTDG